MKKEKQRRFKGKLNNFIDKEERNLMKKALKCYLRGASQVTYHGLTYLL